MVFTSLTFLLYFLPSVIILYYIIPKKYPKARNLLLLVFSLFFYFAGETKAVVWMVYSIGINYLFGRLIDKASQRKLAKAYLALALMANLSCLVYFKYTNFFIDNTNYLLGTSLDSLDIIMPIGISFYTFQGLSYVIDLYRKQVPVQKSILDLGLYIALFPQLIAGPIVRYSTIQEEIQGRRETLDDFAQGLSRFIVGFSKKLLLANSFGLLVQRMDTIQDPGAISAWFYALAFGLQIYYDFSGYSDMAIGLGRIFGFHFLENFNYPYMAQSIGDFWRRWHMSLSTWFRDYVYIPLGGNRLGPVTHISNLLIVWFLTGLWHGASWNFILWGLYYGILLIIEAYIIKDRFKIPRIITLALIFFGWNIFVQESTPDLIQSLENLLGLRGLGSPALTLFYLRQYWPEFLAGALLTSPLLEKVEKAKVPPLFFFLYIGLFGLSFMKLLSSSFNPFIYFRF